MEPRIKLIWIIDGLGPGGAERLMVPILQNLDKDLFDMRVCVLQERQGNPIADEIKKLDIPVDLVKIEYLRSPKNLPRLVNYLKKNQPNIIHTQLQFSDILGSLSAKILRIPIISTQHTIELFSTTDRAGWRQRFAWFCLRNLFNRVIAVSEETRRHHITFGKLNPKKIITIYNGINIPQFSELPVDTREKTRKALGIPQNTIVALTVAVLREQKGLQYMIAAIPAVIKKLPNFLYLVVGDGPYREKIGEAAQEFQINQKVIFTGHRDDIPDLFAASDVFILPTLGDALPTVLFEALAARKPIIASEVGGIPEIITNNYNGLLVPPGSSSALSVAILDLMLNPTKPKNFIHQGFEVVTQKFNINLQVQNLTNLYFEVLNERKSRPD